MNSPAPGAPACAETAGSIHDFWFGDDPDDARVAAGRAALWWSKHDETDRRIRERFEACLHHAANGRLDHWAAMPAGRLALILLADQFPRNMYRGTPRAFDYDALARGWCEEGLRERADLALRPIERVFFYLPLEHSESMDDQERCVALFRELVDGLDAPSRPAFDGFLDYARRHREVIARFGRFPHRNRILGRPSTEAEAAFLTQPGSSF